MADMVWATFFQSKNPFKMRGSATFEHSKCQCLVVFSEGHDTDAPLDV